jgi:hypothetical protein
MNGIIPITRNKRVLKEHRKEIIYSAASSFVISLGYLIWSHFQGSVFIWQSISPIEQPSIFVRAFYSALAFAVPGYLLYIAGFYKFLHNVIVKGLNDWQLYRGIKALIWIGLIFLMYEVFAVIVHIANAVISFFYNIFNLVLYLSPGIGIFLILTVIGTYGLALAKNRLKLPRN